MSQYKVPFKRLTEQNKMLREKVKRLDADNHSLRLELNRARQKAFKTTIKTEQSDG